MFATEDDDAKPTFNQITPNNNNSKPIVSGGLFGGTDLKEDVPTTKGGKSKINSIFDYEDSDDEKHKNDDLEEKQRQDIEGRKKTALFKIDEDDDDDNFMFKPNGMNKPGNLF